MKCTLWNDCRGGVITTELVLVASFVTAILLGGLGVLKKKISNEFESLGEIVESQKVDAPTEMPGPVKQQPGIEIEGDFDSVQNAPDVNL